MNNNLICQHYCLLPINQCYYYHSKDICCNCCSYSISIEEILTWIVICSLIFFLYNTIKLCIIIFLILSIIYWIYKQTEIPRLLKEFYEKQINSKSSTDKQMSDVNNILPNENDNDQDSLLNKTVTNSSI
jgi:hypothetical protein